MSKFVSKENLEYIIPKLAKKSEIPTNYVSYNSQTLTDAQKQQARKNIGAGTSNFSGSYTDLVNLPTIPSTANFVDKSSTQTIGGTKTFTDNITANGDIYLSNDKYIYAKNKSGTNQKILGLNTNNDLLLGSALTDIVVNADLKVSTTYSGTRDLGSSTGKWNDIYFSGSLHDGTNSIKVKDIVSKSTLTLNYATKTELSNYATKDSVEGVLLWQNGNPTGSMAYTEITGLPISEYDEFDLYYKASSGANICMQKMTIRKGTNSDQYFIVSTVSVSNGSMSYRSRVCAIKLTGSLIFETAYNGTSVKNDYIIPVLFYGRKV